jgi:hypothetical protein
LTPEKTVKTWPKPPRKTMRRPWRKLKAEHIEAIEAMIEALEDEGSRTLIEVGMMLSTVNQKKSLPESRLRVVR